MPKVKRIRAAALAGKRRQDPLGQVIQDDINKDKFASVRGRQKVKRTKMDDDEFLDEKTSQRILKLSKQQQLEIEAEEEWKRRKQLELQNEHADSSDEEGDVEEDDFASVDGDDDYVQHDEGFVTVMEGAEGLSAEDEALVASMMNPSSERRTLADFILEKIDEKGAHSQEDMDDGPSSSLPPKVVEVYTEIGKLLSHYTSGKLPKAFKVIPSLSNWEEILYLTRPDLWTPQAMFAATRIFCSNLNPKMAQRFYNLVLLDAVRGDIQYNKKLNYHYYMALKKSVYKPAAFFKGILLPLSKDNCTLREAAIIASVLQRVSIPVHHSAVAIHKLAQQREYSAATSIFIKTLLNKKYSLPSPVIGSLVRHFASFITDKRELPVLWHQSLLVFCQRYKNEVQDESRDALKRVMKVHFHSKITPEIRRELFGLQAFKEERKNIRDDDMEM